MSLDFFLQNTFLSLANTATIDPTRLWLAFLYTTLAGLSTVVGGAIVLFTKKQNKKLLALGLGVAAGVMIYISLVEMLAHESLEFFEDAGLDDNAGLYMIGFFVVGLGVSYIIDLIIPHIFHLHSKEDKDTKNEDEQKLFHSGVFTALGIGLHNLPEGLITFVATLADPRLGLAIGIAVALHNIPEGLSVAMPIYHATGSKLKAMWYTFLAGIAEPLGALIAYLFLLNFLDQLDFAFGVIFAMVAGIMIYISFDEILPTGYRYDKGHLVLYGTLSGMVLMALTLVVLH